MTTQPLIVFVHQCTDANKKMTEIDSGYFNITNRGLAAANRKIEEFHAWKRKYFQNVIYPHHHAKTYVVADNFKIEIDLSEFEPDGALIKNWSHAAEKMKTFIQTERNKTNV
jgi:hypothetical protein